MKEILLVKHAVGGRTFIDTGKAALPYTVVREAEGWIFHVETKMNEQIQEILKWKHELNVFIFQEYTDQPTKKIWFYVNKGPVDFDVAHGRLTIVTQSRIEYVPDQFGTLKESSEQK